MEPLYLPMSVCVIDLEELVSIKISESASEFEKIPGIVVIHHLESSGVVWMSKNGLDILDTSVSELRKLGEAYHQKYFNIEDAREYVPKILGMLDRNNCNETITFFQQVRRSSMQDWTWYACGIRIFMQNEKGEPYLTVTVALPIETHHYMLKKASRILQENAFKRSNKHLFATLTKREKQILALMSKDHSSPAIASRLNLSVETVKTHRKRIKAKLQAKNQHDIMQFGHAFDV